MPNVYSKSQVVPSVPWSIRRSQSTCAMPPATASSDLIHQACQAALRGDSAQIAKSLLSTRIIPSRIDNTLLLPSEVSLELLERLSSSTPLPKCNADHALRALLLVSPCYETPWRAVVVLIKTQQAKLGWLGASKTAMFSGMADAQTFLQQTISFWWKHEGTGIVVGSRQSEEGKKSTPRDWLFRIAQLALRPLQDERAAVIASDNRHWVIPLDLVATIVTLCQELEGTSSTTSEAILDEMLKNSILRARILFLLSLAYGLRAQLRDHHWLKLHSFLNEALESNLIPPDDLPGIARLIISSSEKNQKWKFHLLHLLHSASKDTSTYSTVETVVQSSLSSQSTQTLCDWQSVEPIKTIPSWILANYHLLLFQAARQAGSEVVSRLIRKALSEDEKDYNILHRCSQSLISLCLPSLSSYRRKCDVRSLQQLLSEAKYDGEGTFSRRKQRIKELDLTILVQSLFLGSTKLEHRLQKLSSAERAQGWVHAAMSMLTKSDFSTTVGAVLIIVTVFCEVPASRSTLVRSMVREGKSLNDVDCIIVSMLVRSLPCQSELEVLEPVSHYLSSMTLPFNIFRQLADVFAHTASGRTTILLRSQKTLHASSAPWWAAIENRGRSERIESMQSALYGLCALLVEWDDVSLRAWTILSDFLVIGKPPLPLPVRSWLYGVLLDSVQQDRLPASVLEHLCRALLTRLLSYFAAVGDELKFVPQRAVACFAGSQEAIVKENLSALFSLVVVVALKVANAEGINPLHLEHWRLQLQSITSNQSSTTFELGDNLNSLCPYAIVSSLLASSVSFVSCQIDKDKPIPAILITPSVGTLASLITKNERQSYAQAGISSRDDTPQWLSSASDMRSCSNDAEPPRSLYVSICRIATYFLCQSFVPLNVDMQSALVSSLASLYHCRMKVETSFPMILVDDREWVQSISPETLLLCAAELERTLEDAQTSLEDLDKTMTALESICDDVSASARSTRESCTQSYQRMRMLGAISRLYHTVASEYPIVRLFRYLEDKCSTRRTSQSQAQGIPGITCSEDAERVVHDFRTKVLRTFADCMVAVSKGSVGDVSTMNTKFIETIQHLEIEGIHAFVFVSHLLKSTTADLLEGLRCQSGGITSRMYNLYLEIVETASIVIQQAVVHVHDHLLVDDSINTAINLFSEILCSFTIAAPLFKKTIDIAAVLLPSIHRRLVLRSFAEKSTIKHAPTTFLNNLSSQVLTILNSKSSGAITTWSQPAEQNEQLNEDSGNTESDNLSDEHTGGIPLEIDIPSGRVALSTITTNETFNFANEVAWTHALNAIFSAADGNLAEAWECLQDGEIPGAQINNFLECQGYISWRKEETSAYMDLLCRCLKQVDVKTNDAGRPRVLVQFMPTASKLKFLVVLDKLVLLLTKVLRLFILSIQHGRKNSSRSIAEVIAIVATWIPNETLDVIHGVRRWFLAERVSDTINSPVSVDKVLTRLPTTVFRVDELERGLRKLDTAMTLWKKEKESPQSSRLKQVEDVIGRAILIPCEDITLAQDVSFAQHISNRLGSGTVSINQGSDYDEDYAQLLHSHHLPIESGRLTKRKRYQDDMAKRLRRDRLRPIPRSRNPVIDLYQQLDHGECYDDDEADSDDAYADLEGFLVEG